VSSNLSERGLIIVTAIVWAALAVVGALVVMYTGIDGVVFDFIVFIIAISVWARVIKLMAWRSVEAGGNLEKQLSELSSRISELNAKIDELKKAIEE